MQGHLHSNVPFYERQATVKIRIRHAVSGAEAHLCEKSCKKVMNLYLFTAEECSAVPEHPEVA